MLERTPSNFGFRGRGGSSICSCSTWQSGGALGYKLGCILVDGCVRLVAIFNTFPLVISANCFSSSYSHSCRSFCSHTLHSSFQRPGFEVDFVLQTTELVWIANSKHILLRSVKLKSVSYLVCVLAVSCATATT